MTAKASKCCCTSTPCSGTCAFASSYAVTGISGSYSFQRTATDISGCGFVCFARNFTISLSWTQLGSLVVTKQTSAGGAAPCCYSGTGTLVVSGTLEVEELYRGGICGDQTQVRTYSFERDVPCAVTISCGNEHACGFSVVDPPGWTHTLHICDFLVTCSHEGIAGDCDTCPQPFGPYAIRCVGGRVSYLSAIVAPDSISQSGCLGLYTGGCCGACPFTAMQYNAGAYGPFACVLDEECSEQDPYGSCTLGIQATAFLRTRVDSDALSTPWLADPASTTKSVCGSTDWSGGPNSTCVTDILQQGCSSGIPWDYA